jgi:hypothetical protein
MRRAHRPPIKGRERHRRRATCAPTTHPLLPATRAEHPRQLDQGPYLALSTRPSLLPCLSASPRSMSPPRSMTARADPSNSRIVAANCAATAAWPSAAIRVRSSCRPATVCRNVNGHLFWPPTRNSCNDCSTVAIPAVAPYLFLSRCLPGLLIVLLNDQAHSALEVLNCLDWCTKLAVGNKARVQLC